MAAAANNSDLYAILHTCSIRMQENWSLMIENEVLQTLKDVVSMHTNTYGDDMSNCLASLMQVKHVNLVKFDIKKIQDLV